MSSIFIINLFFGYLFVRFLPLVVIMVILKCLSRCLYMKVSGRYRWYLSAIPCVGDLFYFDDTASRVLVIVNCVLFVLSSGMYSGIVFVIALLLHFYVQIKVCEIEFNRDNRFLFALVPFYNMIELFVNSRCYWDTKEDTNRDYDCSENILLDRF